MSSRSPFNLGLQHTLPSFGATADYTTLSGWSGGSFMAANLHVMYSESFKGVGLVNGGGYANGDFMDNAGIFEYQRTATELGDLSFEYASNYSTAGEIDDIANLNGQPVMIFSGGKDFLVHSTLQEGQKDFYEQVGSNVTFINNEDFGHVWPSDVEVPWYESFVIPTTCIGFEFPVGNCGTDGAGIILDHLLPNIPGSTVEAGIERDMDWRSKGVVKKFDQREFIDQEWWEYTGLDKYGYVFYPNQCFEDGVNCKVHVYVHGCNQMVRLVGQGAIHYSGLNEYAVANDIIILHPQALTSGRNLWGCWDAGVGNFFLPDNFDKKDGLQGRTIMNMVDRLYEDKDTELYDYTSMNLLDRNYIIENWARAINIIPLAPRLGFWQFVTIFVWYPLNYEYFGWCWACFFTLWGFQENSEPWLTRTELLNHYVMPDWFQLDEDAWYGIFL